MSNSISKLKVEAKDAVKAEAEVMVMPTTTGETTGETITGITAIAAMGLMVISHTILLCSRMATEHLTTD
jgi:hypothetical protein